MLVARDQFMKQNTESASLPLNIFPTATMAAELQPLGSLIPTVILSIFWGTMTFIRMVVNAVRSGPSKFFHAPTRQVRPTVMNDSTLGEHKFILLKVRCRYFNVGCMTNFLIGLPKLKRF